MASMGYTQNEVQEIAKRDHKKLSKKFILSKYHKLFYHNLCYLWFSILYNILLLKQVIGLYPAETAMLGTTWGFCSPDPQLFLFGHCTAALNLNLEIQDLAELENAQVKTAAMLRGSHFISLVLREYQQKTLVVLRKFWPLRDCQQLTSIMLNKFCLLSQTPNPLFLTDNTKIDGIPTKIKWKIHDLFTHCISSFEGTSNKNLYEKSPDFLFLVVFISFYW